MRQMTFRLKPGQSLKEEIDMAAENVRAGVILSIVGSLRNANLRMAGATTGNQVVRNFDGPFEVVSGTGTISKDGCHIHISVADNNGRVIGGHLKDGCKVDTTLEVVIAIFDDMSYKRLFDVETGFKELSIN